MNNTQDIQCPEELFVRPCMSNESFFSFEENSSFREKLFLNKLSFEVEGVMYQKESLVSSLNPTACTDDVV